MNRIRSHVTYPYKPKPESKYKTWTLDEDILLDDLCKTESWVSIAKRIGRSAKSVRIRANRIGITREAQHEQA
jgi:hypothetical protein